MASHYSESRRPFAKRSLGQNFLVDQNCIRKIIAAIGPSPADVVVEIGPGRGALTELLIATGAKVVAVELDRDLIPILLDRYGRNANFHLIEQNALDVDFLSLANAERCRLKLVANLPYYISTAILQELINQRDAFSEMVLMFQREVVERMVAKPGDPRRGFLSVLVEAFLNVRPVFDVPPAAFRPVPKVWSSVVCIRPSTAYDPAEEDFKDLISVGFQQPRKTIYNNLKRRYSDIGKVLSRCDVAANSRPERLNQEQWKCLSLGLRDRHDLLS